MVHASIAGITGSENTIMQAVDYGDQPLENLGDESVPGVGADEAEAVVEDIGADADIPDVDPPQVTCYSFLSARCPAIFKRTMANDPLNFN